MQAASIERGGYLYATIDFTPAVQNAPWSTEAPAQYDYQSLGVPMPLSAVISCLNVASEVCRSLVIASAQFQPTLWSLNRNPSESIWKLESHLPARTKSDISVTRSKTLPRGWELVKGTVIVMNPGLGFRA